jgi:hypothetical protein
MALTAPKEKQVSFARQIAWERGQRLAVVPDTSSELSAVIEHLLAMPSLPITDDQVDRIRQLNEQCVVAIDGFVPVSELPAGRDGGNRVIYSLRSRLSRVKFHAAKANASSFLAPAGAEGDAVVAAATAVVPDEDAPF